MSTKLKEKSQINLDEYQKEFVEAIKSGKALEGKDGVFTKLIKHFLEAALEGEINHHLSEEDLSNKNRRNGYSSKKVKTGYGQVEINTPRDRDSDFEPQIVKKRQNTLGDSIDNKIISLYALGMSQADIRNHVEEMYGLEISEGMITNITDKILPEIQEWQNRPLESMYAVIWMDCIFYKIREDGEYKNKAIYNLLGLKMDGRKEILGLYTAETEGAKFWLSVLTQLKNRGVQKILISCVDGLKGFPNAIESIFPETEVQLCIVHQIRNSLKYVASKNQKEFMSDLKKVYKSNTKEEGQQHLLELEEKWSKQYRLAVQGWIENWEILSNFFKYPAEIRRIVYTTNPIESVNRRFRKITKTKGGFVNEHALMKLLYLTIKELEKKWTQPVPNWSLVVSQLSIFFNLDLTSISRI